MIVLSSKLHGRGHSDKHAEHSPGVCLQQTCSPPTTRILGAGGLKEQKRRPNAGRRQRFRSHAASHAGKVAPCFSCVRRAVDLDRAHDRRANGLVARKKIEASQHRNTQNRTGGWAPTAHTPLCKAVRFSLDAPRAQRQRNRRTTSLTLVRSGNGVSAKPNNAWERPNAHRRLGAS